MVKIQLKKTDISRLLRGLSLLEIKEEIRKEDYIRLYKKLFKLLESNGKKTKGDLK
jgi:rhamnogalacturonyl hydrolase YesR